MANNIIIIVDADFYNQVSGFLVDNYRSRNLIKVHLKPLELGAWKLLGLTAPPNPREHISMLGAFVIERDQRAPKIGYQRMAFTYGDGQKRYSTGLMHQHTGKIRAFWDQFEEVLKNASHVLYIFEEKYSWESDNSYDERVLLKKGLKHKFSQFSAKNQFTTVNWKDVKDNLLKHVPALKEEARKDIEDYELKRLKKLEADIINL